jgi:predicted dehydrogenase
MVRIGVIGYGYWGPNIVRNLHSLEGCQIAAVSDQNPAALERVTRTYPGLPVTTNAAELLTSPAIDAIAVVTPVCTHFGLAKAALENGKHVFIEKPFTATTAEAEELMELADRKKLKIMVDQSPSTSPTTRSRTSTSTGCPRSSCGRP